MSDEKYSPARLAVSLSSSVNRLVSRCAGGTDSIRRVSSSRGSYGLGGGGGSSSASTRSTAEPRRLGDPIPMGGPTDPRRATDPRRRLLDDGRSVKLASGEAFVGLMLPRGVPAGVERSTELRRLPLPGMWSIAPDKIEPLRPRRGGDDLSPSERGVRLVSSVKLMDCLLGVRPPAITEPLGRPGVIEPSGGMRRPPRSGWRRKLLRCGSRTREQTRSIERRGPGLLPSLRQA